jgi:hypothetical protein
MAFSRYGQTILMLHECSSRISTVGPLRLSGAAQRFHYRPAIEESGRENCQHGTDRRED